MANSRRLFISGVPVEASEDEIRKRFQVFGDVSSIEKVVRGREGFPTKCFAYLDISLSDASYHKCLSQYSKAKWKGNQLLIQPAKESFLRHLETERHQETLDDSSLKKPNISPSSSSELQVKSKDGRRLMKVNVLKNSKKIKRFSSQSVMENNGSVSDLTWDLTPTMMTDESSMSNGSLVKTKEDKTSKRKKSNKLRLEALERSKDHHNPLIVEESKANSHIVFEQEDKEEVMSDGPGEPKEITLLPLFGSDSEDNGDDGMEVSKPKFEGKLGAKLFKLQQKIGWDKRFEVDERFLNTSDSSSDESASAEQDEESSGDEELRKEQQRNRDLIEEMFGNTSSVTIPQSQTVPEVLRYDPSAMGSELLEKQPPPVKKKVRIVEHVKASTPPTKQLQEADKPEISKECFYTVSNSLKDVLKTAEGGHVFNFTTSTPKDKQSTSTPVTGSKTPNWLLNLQDDDSDESSGSDEDETASTTGPHSDGQIRTLFFFHANSSELRNRLDCPDTKFVRTCSLEELEAKWPQTRTRLKDQYKRRHRDALRWRRQRKQIK